MLKIKKYMDISIGHFCLVGGFLDDGFSANEISDALTPLIYSVMHDNDQTISDDWRLIFQANYNNGKSLLVSRNRLGSYISDKMKYITIVIPIPLKTEIEWGVNPEQHLYKKDHYDKLMKNFFELDVDYRSFTNRTDYITTCLKAGIKKSFREGFTVGNTEIRVKKEINL
jgi:hypothetical protein